MGRYFLILIFWFFSSVALAQGLLAAKPWLGVSIEKHPNGIIITHVHSGTPALKSGLKVGDIVQKINGVTVRDTGEMISHIQGIGLGRKVTLTIMRQNQTRVVTTVLQPRPDLVEIMDGRLVGLKAPPFDLPSLDGVVISPAKLAGKPLLIMFWATWCPACKESLPVLASFMERQQKRIHVALISTESQKTLREFFATRKPPFYILHDPKGKVSAGYMMPAIPTFIFIDHKGRVQQAVVGGGLILAKLLQSIDSSFEQPTRP